MQAVLESLFFQSFTTKPMTTHSLRHLRDKQIVVASVDLATKALEFMNYVKKRQNDGEPYHIREWHEYLSTNGLTVSTYESIISRLLAAGLLRQETGVLHVSSPTEFESILSKMLNAVQVWREYGR